MVAVNLPVGYWRSRGLMFGQVREDAAIERGLVEDHGAVRRAVVIASAGCTLVALADLVREELWGVDLNPAQVELARTRIEAWATDGYAEWAARMANAGRVDGVLAMLRRLLFTGVHSRVFVEDFLRMDSVGDQLSRFGPEWDTWRWRWGTEVAFNSAVLQMGFGREVRRALPGSLAGLVRERVERILTRFPCAGNSYLWQAFLGRDAPNGGRGWRERGSGSEAGRVRVVCGEIGEWLAGREAGSVDFFGLSNVLELAGSARARDLLGTVERVAAEGAVVCVRAILPVTLEGLPERVGRLRLDVDASARAAAVDRGVVCNFFRVYRAESH